ncbi:MAG TPA: efflux RND transporter periplasmic adaptor subunit [Bacteroidia bacterium]|nr:efflux RND transporter periplasmic adaptor subunit [Bacteroidia bacterium]
MKTIYLVPIISIFLFSCTEKPVMEPGASQKPNTVSLTEEQLKNINLDTARLVPEEEDLSLTGKISFDESKVGKVFPLVGGNVIKVTVALGDYVHKGQLLATIRSTDISDLQSQYSVAQNNEAIAKKNLDIAEELYKTNVNSETQVLSVRNEYSRSQSETNRLKQALAVYGANTENSDGLYNVYSPIEGYVVEKNVNEEMEIRSDNGTNIFTVSALNTVWVLADVYESDLSKIALGDEVEVSTLAYEGKIFKGTVGQIGNLLDPETKTMKIRIVMDNSEGLLKPEMFAVVKVHIGHPTKSISIPSTSVLFDNNRFYVMVRKDKTNFEKREVVLGPVMGKNTYIKKGIQEGEVLVTEGSLLVESNNF